MHLTLLPYELLQLIAGNLLPRYQCRLAMTSHCCYRYLYNDLLRWHANKASILPPRHKYHNTKNNRGLSLIQYNNKVVLYDHYGGLTIYNLTNMIMTVPGNATIIKIAPCAPTNAIYCRKSNILYGCYKYMNIQMILMSMQRKHPFIGLEDIIPINIYPYLTRQDQHNLEQSSIYIAFMMMV